MTAVLPEVNDGFITITLNPTPPSSCTCDFCRIWKKLVAEAVPRALAGFVQGVELLDREMPDWWERVNPENLHIESSRECVLGQLYGDYGSGMEELNIPDGVKYGFFGETMDAIKVLNEKWKGEIYDRRTSKAGAVN